MLSQSELNAIDITCYNLSMEDTNMTLSEDIRPSADLRNHYNEISKQCHEKREAVIITVNGKGDTVSMSYEDYKQLKNELKLYELLAQSEDDQRNGRVAPIDGMFDRIKSKVRSMDFNNG